MTGYAYKLVSNDERAKARAVDRGWEPVPAGEMPVPFPNPLDMTPRQLEAFCLFRMGESAHAEVLTAQRRLNAAIEDPLSHTIIASYNIDGNWPPVGAKLGSYFDEDANETRHLVVTEEALAGAKLARDWMLKAGV